MPRSSLDEEPAAQHIRELHEHIQQHQGWSRQRTLDAEFIEMYDGESGIKMDNTAARGRKRRIEPERAPTGEAIRIVDLLVSFYTEPPPFAMQFTGERQLAQRKAETNAQAINEAVDQLNPATDSPWKAGVRDTVLLGRRAELIASGRAYWFDFPWKGEGEGEREWAQRSAEWRRKAPLPIVWFNLPAASTFPASLGTVDDEVLCTKTVSWLDLLEMFDENELAGIEGPEDKGRWSQDLTLGIYSNRAWLAYILLAQNKSGGVGPIGASYEDKVLRTIEHKLERCAIRILPGETGKKEEGYYWKSMLYPVRQQLKLLDTLKSRVATAAKFEAYPLMMERVPAAAIGEGEGKAGDIRQVAEGDVLTYPTADRAAGQGESGMWPVFQPQHGQQIREFYIHELDRIAQITGTPRTLEGDLSPNTPAWSVNSSLETAKGTLRPLTSALLHGAIDIAETLGRAVIAFGEPIPLAKLDKDGNRQGGTILLKPEDLKDYEPVVTARWEPKLPLNWRADMDAGLAAMERARVLGWPSEIWLMDQFMGIGDPWRQYQESLEIRFMMSEDMKNFQLRRIMERLEGELAKDQGMTPEEFERVAEKIPEPMRSMLRQQVSAGGQAGGNGAVNPATRGALRAGSPFTAGPGGPRPTEVLPQ